MSAHDFTLWRRFLAAYPTLATAYYYDVALGNGEPLAPTAPPADAAMWTRLTSLRADVIAELEARWLLIELRDNAGTGALGSLLAYTKLWRDDPPDDRPINPWLVTNRIHPDLRDILPLHDINLVIV